MRRLAKLATIPELARALGQADEQRYERHRCTMWRRLMSLRAKDRYLGHPVDWLFRWGRTWRVNVSALKVAHPELFARADVRELALEVSDLKETVKMHGRRINSLGARVRELGARSPLLQVVAPDTPSS